ncbi:MAG TPA: YraN family protein [Spongiibacteraceae bacterium]|nr:YraN family protein [Spongiibacteraceae bacterium]
MFHRKPTPTKTDSGAAIENAAAMWLQAQGMACVARNFRCRGGEIDLIMRDGRTLVFVEVRLRNREDFGNAAESVTAAKQRRVIHAAQYYLATHLGCADLACRFDVLAAKCENETIVWNWVQDAFYAG